MYVCNQVFLVLGLSKSGTSATKEIIKRGGRCYIYEELKSLKIENAISELVEMGAIYVESNSIEQILPNIDVLILSPGVAINHSVAVRAKQLNKRIIGELELGYQLLMPNIIAVTGTNGKTTTVSFIDAILKQANVNGQLCGNVGAPITACLEKKEDKIYIAEVSSFQLESVNRFCPHIACFISFAPDHLERHYSMENYLFLKKRLFKTQTQSEYAVLNYDDKIISEIDKEIKSKPIYVSLRQVVDGAYLDGQNLFYKGEQIMSIEQLALKGEHNVYNALFAIAVSKLIGISNNDISTALMSFKGVRHRVELIAEINGVKFYDDSKATNTASTISALRSMVNPTILILGGSEKGEDYNNLFTEINLNNVLHTVITGASGFNMIKVAEEKGYKNYTFTNDFERAVNIAKMLAKSGENVLLSPACASFDCFNNFEERGDAFNKIVNGKYE